MADPKAYAEWLVANQDKKGTPDFDAVAKAYQASRQQAVAPASSPQAQAPRGFASYAGEAIQKIPAGLMDFATSGNTGTLGQGMNAAGSAIGTPAFLRTAPPIAAAMMFPPSALEGFAGAAAPLASSAINSVSAYIASKFAGDRNSDAISNAVLAGYAGVGPAKVSSGVFKDFLTNSSLDAIGLGGTVLAADIARQTMEKGPENVDLKEAFKSVPITAILSPVSGALRTLGARADYTKGLVEDARAALSEAVGIDNPTLGMLNPQLYAKMEARIATTRPDLFARINQAGKDVTSRYQSLFGSVPSDAQIAAGDLGKYVGKLDEERQTLAALTKKSQDAQQALSAAQQAGLNRFEVQGIAKDVYASQLGQINQAARVKFFENLKDQVSGALKPISQTAADFSSSVNQVFKVRSAAASQLYAESGVNLDQRFIPVGNMEAAAKQAMAGRTGPIADGIIQTIHDAGEKGMASVNEMRDMCQRFADSFAGLDPKQLNNAEELAAKAYRAVTDTSLNHVKSTFGDDAAAALGRANDYWRETAQTANSRYVRPVLRNEPSVSMVQSLANDISNGRMEEVDGYLKFVDAVAQQAPDVANLGRKALYDATRESFLNKAINAGGEIDLEKLTNQLNLAGKRGFPIDQLGFGTPAQLNAVKQTFRLYNPKGAVVDSAALDEFYNNPLVQGHLKSGQQIPPGVTDRIAAKSAFTNLVREDIIREKLGAQVRKGVDDVAQRQALAKAAGMDQAAQERYVNKLSQDPMFSVFDNTTLGFPKMTGEAPGGITKALQSMAPEKASQIMTVMREKRPDLAADVEARHAADVLRALVPDVSTPGATWRVDGDKVRQFFNPALKGDASNPVNTARAVLSPDTFARFEKTVRGFNQISEYMKAGRGTSAISDPEVAAGLAYGLTQGKVTQSGIAAAALDKVYNLLDGRRYSLVSRLLVDPEAATAFYRSRGEINRMMNNLGPQRAALLMANQAVKSDLMSLQRDQPINLTPARPQ